MTDATSDARRRAARHLHRHDRRWSAVAEHGWNNRFVLARYDGRVDFRRPVEALIPGVQGAVARRPRWDHGATEPAHAGEAGRREPSAGLAPLLPNLVELGLVERTDVPPSALFRLVDGHLGAELVRQLASLRRTALARLGQLAGGMEPASAGCVVFGSMATGEAEAGSDIDVLLVRRDKVDEDDERWHAALERFRVAGRELTGNPISVLEVSQGQLTKRLGSGEPLWRDIAKHGLVVHGPPLPATADLSRG
ncbi:MAG: hypothetical protein GEV08_21600 [Acidimicrobiia bacterium]|nr:hypothetical protein [Acidimicrobiia bacterium]